MLHLLVWEHRELVLVLRLLVWEHRGLLVLHLLVWVRLVRPLRPVLGLLA